jgi:hypothetical protein
MWLNFMVKKLTPNSATRLRADGRRSLLVYLRQDVIKKLKMAALEEERPAYEIAEEAISQWLAAPGRTQKRKGEKS